MPSSITHAYFARDVLKELKIGKEKINTMELNYFAQCTDPFHFYHVLKPWKKRRKEIQRFSHTFHDSDGGRFLAILTKKIKEKNLQTNPEVLSFLYGYIAHYVLDSTIHPYVIYFTGTFEKEDKRSYKYNCLHNEMEAYLDRYIYEKREKKNFSKYKTHKDLFQIHPLNQELQTILDEIIFQIYDFKDFSKYYYQSLKDMKFVFQHLRYDPYGILEKAYIVFDKVMPSSILNAKFLSFHFIPKNARQYLNHNHQLWCYPNDPRKKSHESFDELYEKSKEKAKVMIQEVDNYLFSKKEIDLSKVLGHLSYSTGLNASLVCDTPKYRF